MILRRIIAHFRKQEWTAIFLDFVIVVAGILIAFQINEWNERRMDRVRADIHLSQIAFDLKADIAEMDENIARANWRYSAMNAILEAAGKPLPRRITTESGAISMREAAPFISDDPYAAVAAITIIKTLDGNRHAYDALISTGDLRLLMNHPASRAIEDYYASVDEVKDIEDTIETATSAFDDSKHRRGISIFNATTLEEISAIVRADPQFSAELQTLALRTNQQIGRESALRDKARALLSLIEEDRS